MFDPDTFYEPTDPAMRQIAARQTLAKWRSEGRGPAFYRCGSRIIYKGADLIAWLEAHRVEPTAA